MADAGSPSSTTPVSTLYGHLLALSLGGGISEGDEKAKAEFDRVAVAIEQARANESLNVVDEALQPA